MTKKRHWLEILQIGYEVAVKAFRAGDKKKRDNGNIDLSKLVFKNEILHIHNHLDALRRGERIDPDGFPHTGAIIARASIMAALEKDIEEGR